MARRPAVEEMNESVVKVWHKQVSKWSVVCGQSVVNGQVVGWLVGVLVSSLVFRWCTHFSSFTTPSVTVAVGVGACACACVVCVHHAERRQKDSSRCPPTHCLPGHSSLDSFVDRLVDGFVC